MSSRESPPAKGVGAETVRPEEGKAESALCPISGTPGRAVRLLTVKAVLSAAALRRLDGRAYRFCPEPACDVVYFDAVSGSLFRKQDLSVRVGLKETKDPIPLCYCFGFTVSDVREEIARLGRTNIPATITAEIRAGHCACEVRNPEGNCCLGNVSKAIRWIGSGRDGNGSVEEERFAPPAREVGR